MQAKALEDVFPVGVGDSGYHLGDAKEILGNLAHGDIQVVIGGGYRHGVAAFNARRAQAFNVHGKAHSRDAAEIRAELGQVLRAGINQHHVMARFVQGFRCFAAQQPAANNHNVHV